jgi:hypothetical protein
VLIKNLLPSQPDELGAALARPVMVFRAANPQGDTAFGVIDAFSKE